MRRAVKSEPRDDRGRVDRISTRTSRLFKLLMVLLDDRRERIPFAEFGNREEWGDPRTFNRLRQELNRLWRDHRQRPLFVIVDRYGRQTDRGERFFIVMEDFGGRERRRVSDEETHGGS